MFCSRRLNLLINSARLARAGLKGNSITIKAPREGRVALNNSIKRHRERRPVLPVRSSVRTYLLSAAGKRWNRVILNYDGNARRALVNQWALNLSCTRRIPAVPGMS